MPCSWCGFEAMTSTGRAGASSVGAVYHGTPSRCERCGATLPSDETAALYRDKLRMLARFGLASDTRLLLETSPEEA